MRFLSFSKILAVSTLVGVAALFSAFQSQSGAFCRFAAPTSNLAMDGSAQSAEASPVMAANVLPTLVEEAPANVAAGSPASRPASVAAPVTSSDDTSSQQEFKDAPDFTLETLEGDPFTLSDHEGKVVVLNVWATWCPPCRKEIPDFIEIQEEMEDEGVLFVGVSVDEEGWDAVRPFAKDYDFNYPLVVDDGVVTKEYGPFRGIPTTFIINKKGQVEYVAPGMVTKAMIKPALQELAQR